MTAPRIDGDRLAIVFGHSLPSDEFDGAQRQVAVGRQHQPVSLIESDDFVVLPRHGVAEYTPAHRIDHHANIRALCESGCDRVLALCSVGSLRPDWPVGTIVCPDDFIAPHVNPTYHTGAAGHVVPAIDTDWRRHVVDVWSSTTDTLLLDGATYAQTRGPRFETRAEVRRLSALADLVGMTMAAEVILAQEAGLSYAALCTVDNLANGLDTMPLTVEAFEANKAENRARLRIDLDKVVPELAGVKA